MKVGRQVLKVFICAIFCHSVASLKVCILCLFLSCATLNCSSNKFRQHSSGVHSNLAVAS